jgi:tellurite resistance protein TehA-like permease
LKRSVEGLSPAYFGLVMATGIVSLAAHLLAFALVARALFFVNVAAYLALWALNAWRFARHRRAMLADATDHLRGPGFFTWVAASAVLGSQFAVLANDLRIAWALWTVAVALWLAFTYGIFAALTVKAEKPALDRGINGTWLLAVVATQSIAVLSVLLAMHEPLEARRALNFLALSMWLWGGMLYVWLMALIFYRYTFFRLAPEDLTPPYWINMGAMAISTLAGSLLVANAGEAPLLQSLLPFLRGFTIFYWATATWWIPMLLVLGAWRYLARGHPLRYSAMYWSAVFPLGMYAAATDEMALALELRFLAGVAIAFFWLALAAWIAAAAALAWQVARTR